MSRARDIASGINTRDDSGESVPHIIPDVLYPAVSGKLLDGTTSHSGNYGTAQSDSRKYYYTDIKGSKPIKDPRIGAHFGSQRHITRSMQLLEQETATHGKNVYSVEGREWMRLCEDGTGSALKTYNDGNGPYIASDDADGHYLEITGYFNSFNLSAFQWSDQFNNATVYLNGTSTITGFSIRGSSNTPLSGSGRYVDAGSLIHGDLSQNTPSLNTIKIVFNSSSAASAFRIGSVELIAQDTTSTANRSKIQIPSQDVVSYGKKFTVSGTPHYNPFATKGDGSASTIPDNTTGDSVATGWAGSTSAYWDSSLDTATSLGLSAWESGGNYYRPVNGGRVVKWVDSTGTIKTSVNMMPPEAHAIDSQTIASGVATGNVSPTGTHNWSTQYLPQFGNKTIGSNLWTAMADNSSYPFETRPSGGLNGAWNNTTGYGLAYVAVTLTQGKLYRIRFDASSVTGVASYIGTASDSAATNWKNKALITNGTNITSVFRADSQTLGIAMHTANGAAAFTLSNMTLYEVEDPNSQSEVAKTYYLREFGNGAGNGGTGATFADASMLAGASDNIAYVMDDGLTSFAGETLECGGSDPNVVRANQWYSDFYFTFIGTGISAETGNTPSWITLANNLPYGTHIVHARGDSGSSNFDILIDGVEVVSNSTSDAYHTFKKLTFHQPKRPPIPEDACVLADYMLMADFVPVGAEGITVSKGVRRVQASRDLFYDCDQAINLNMEVSGIGGFQVEATSGTGLAAGDFKGKLPAFGTQFVARGYGHNRRDIFVNGSDVAQEDSTTHNSHNTYNYPDDTVTINLGLNTFESRSTSTPTGNIEAFEIATPIHTSSHYQPFETPFLHELQGGDRNMEQTNLIVSPNGKTWDQITRDTSYIGGLRISCTTDTQTLGSANVIFDEWRGARNTDRHFFNKGFAVAYDRLICLENGNYIISWIAYDASSGGQHTYIYINDNYAISSYKASGGAPDTQNASYHTSLKRGDHIQVKGSFGYDQLDYNQFNITKVS